MVDGGLIDLYGPWRHLTSHRARPARVDERLG
jgi:hypothetical protein